MGCSKVVRSNVETAVATSCLDVRIAPASWTANLDNDNNEQLTLKMEPTFVLRRVIRSIIKYNLLDIISSCVHAVLQTILKLQHGQTVQKGREPVQRNKVC